MTRPADPPLALPPGQAAPPLPRPAALPQLWTLAPVARHHKPESVELLARVGRSRVRVRIWTLDGVHGARASERHFAVDRFRLSAPPPIGAREAAEIISALPWAGGGADPGGRTAPGGHAARRGPRLGL